MWIFFRDPDMGIRLISHVHTNTCSHLTFIPESMLHRYIFMHTFFSNLQLNMGRYASKMYVACIIMVKHP